MHLTNDQVRHVAKLANLPLTFEEEEKYSEQLSRILGYIEQLNQVDTSGVEPTFNLTGLNNVLREDETIVSLSQADSLSNASKKNDSMFEVKGIFEE